MRTIYLRKDEFNRTRKVLIDMAFFSSYKIIRLLKYLYEEDLYLPFKQVSHSDKIENYKLTKDKILKEDDNFYYFPFPFKTWQVEDVAV